MNRRGGRRGRSEGRGQTVCSSLEISFKFPPPIICPPFKEGNFLSVLGNYNGIDGREREKLRGRGNREEREKMNKD